METVRNSYYSLADNELKFAKSSLNICAIIDDYNQCAALCAQSAEKFMKALVERAFSDIDDLDYLRTHNLRKLHGLITSKYDFPVSSKDCKWLGDFYFDARYPGDNFILVTKEDAEECINIASYIKEAVDDIFNKIEKEKAAEVSELNKLKLFE